MDVVKIYVHARIYNIESAFWGRTDLGKSRDVESGKRGVPVKFVCIINLGERN